MAGIAHDDPDGVEAAEAEKVSDSEKVHGVRIRREDGGYLHLPYARRYATETNEAGKVDHSGP